MPRDLAFDVLADVLIRKRQFDGVFAGHPRLGKLAARDRALAYNIAATTIRRFGQIDALISHCLDKKLPPKAREAKIILRLGTCQLMFMDIPAHAAVSTSVDLAQRKNLGPYKKLINAVLRRIDREGGDPRGPTLLSAHRRAEGQEHRPEPWRPERETAFRHR